MARQYFADVITEPFNTDYGTITATSETILIPLTSCPINPYDARPGKVYELIVGGTATTGTAGTLIVTNRIGTSATLSSDTSIIASPTQNYVPSITTPGFLIKNYLVVRQVGQPGANSTVMCYGYWHSNGAVATAASETGVTWGNTAAVSVDLSIQQYFIMSVTFSVAPSVIPRFHVWRALN